MQGLTLLLIAEALDVVGHSQYVDKLANRLHRHSPLRHKRFLTTLRAYINDPLDQHNKIDHYLHDDPVEQRPLVAILYGCGFFVDAA